MKRLIAAACLGLVLVTTPADAGIRSATAKVGHVAKVVVVRAARTVFVIAYCVGTLFRCD